MALLWWLLLAYSFVLAGVFWFGGRVRIFRDRRDQAMGTVTAFGRTAVPINGTMAMMIDRDRAVGVGISQGTELDQAFARVQVLGFKQRDVSWNLPAGNYDAISFWQMGDDEWVLVYSVPLDRPIRMHSQGLAMVHLRVEVDDLPSPASGVLRALPTFTSPLVKPTIYARMMSFLLQRSW